MGGHVGRMRDTRIAYNILVRKPEGKHFENLSINGKIIL
jgi:hypothetical protein